MKTEYDRRAHLASIASLGGLARARKYTRPIQTEKRCADCGESKPASDFYRRNDETGYLHSYCKPCEITRMLAYQKAHPDAARRNRKNTAWRKMGVDREWYDEMLSAQEWCCAACGDSLLDLRPHQVHVDHDHVTGEGRGILCGHCNVMLGMASDSVDRLVLGAGYLASFSPDYKKQP